MASYPGFLAGRMGVRHGAFWSAGLALIVATLPCTLIVERAKAGAPVGAETHAAVVHGAAPLGGPSWALTLSSPPSSQINTPTAFSFNK